MTEYSRITSYAKRVRKIKNSSKRFFATMLLGMSLTTLVLMSQGWLILRRDLVPLWANVLFSVSMMLSGGLLVHMIDQIALSLKIRRLERMSLEAIHLRR